MKIEMDFAFGKSENHKPSGLSISFIVVLGQEVTRFLNQAHAGHRPAFAWFLKIVSLWMSVCVCVCVYVCMCVPAPAAIKN